jgi:hypothetical protein
MLPGLRIPARALPGEYWGGPVTASTGETVEVHVSDSYPVDPAFQRGIADFLTALYHGSELPAVKVYVATPDEVNGLCGAGEGGCYQPGFRRIFTPGEDLAGGLSKETILAHEYGHYVADNRLNPPWASLDWGPKRWASAESVCARAKQKTAFPGDESGHYALNPGEAWAETYRLLNYEHLRRPDWKFTAFRVDPSFSPDAAAFAAAQEDVLHPWSAPTTTSFSGRFAATPKRPVRRTIATPLDGVVSVQLGRAPAGTTVALESPGGAILRRPARRVDYTVCGLRRLVLVVRATRPGVFTATISKP